MAAGFMPAGHKSHLDVFNLWGLVLLLVPVVPVVVLGTCTGGRKARCLAREARCGAFLTAATWCISSYLRLNLRVTLRLPTSTPVGDRRSLMHHQPPGAEETFTKFELDMHMCIPVPCSIPAPCTKIKQSGLPCWGKGRQSVAACYAWPRRQ